MHTYTRTLRVSAGLMLAAFCLSAVSMAAPQSSGAKPPPPQSNGVKPPAAATAGGAWHDRAAA